MFFSIRFFFVLNFSDDAENFLRKFMIFISFRGPQKKQMTNRFSIHKTHNKRELIESTIEI